MSLTVWTSVTAAITYMRGNYIKVKISCVSDGNALLATDLMALDPGGTGSIVKSSTQSGWKLRHYLEGVTFMAVKADPGVVGATFDFDFLDGDSDAIYSTDDASNTAISWHDMSTDIGLYPPLFKSLYLQCPTTGDWTNTNTIDFHLIGWRENPY